jgi:hypothetical protein
MCEMSEKPLYPHVRVQLTGKDGNAFFILARTTEAMRRAGVPQAKIDGSLSMNCASPL